MSKEGRKVEWSLDFDNMRVRAGQFVTEATGGEQEMKQATMREPLSGAESCRVMLAFSIGRATVRALEVGSPNLFEARLSYVGELDFDVSGGAHRQISLRQKSNSPGEFAATMSKAQDLHWDIRLARDLPIQLELRGGVGDAEIDLSNLTVEPIKVDTGVGKVRLALPGSGARVKVDIRGGVGLTELRLPAGAYGSVNIKGGLGQVRAHFARSNALRLESKAGLGHITLPATMLQVGRAGATKTWQTAEFESAEQQIIISYVGGVGRFELEAGEGG